MHKLKIDSIHELNTTQKSKQHRMQQNKTSLVQSPLMTRPGNEVGLFYNAPKPTGGGCISLHFYTWRNK